MKILVFHAKKILLGITSIIAICILLYASFFDVKDAMARVDEKQLPIYSVDRNDKKIAISFDAAWGQTYTKDILDTLDKYKVKSTFFLVGFWADKYPQTVKEIDSRGHELGNHSSTHPKMSTLTADQMKKELEETSNKIEKITNKEVTLFRPPFGDYNNTLIQTCKELGYYPIQWDVDSLDWKEIGVEHVVDRVVKNVKPGSIVLFHNNAKYIREYLPLVLEKLNKQGYEIVPISQLIHKDKYIMDSNGKQMKTN